ncbi:hypothetical protein AB1Y20_014436 [Prymnesium parvum]|uniref:Thioredoxin domain-containing protein n=1 Tax=Prymnesium parvum TaxID=97485 RepID=A0AB34IH10_PRYPA
MRHSLLLGCLAALHSSEGWRAPHPVPVAATSAAAARRAAAALALEREVLSVADLEEVKRNVRDAARDGGLCVVKWYAPWCKACYALSPRFAGLARAAPMHDRFLQVDIAASAKVAAHYGVKKVPSVSVFAHNQLVMQQTVTMKEYSTFEEGLQAIRVEEVRRS